MQLALGNVLQIKFMIVKGRNKILEHKLHYLFKIQML